MLCGLWTETCVALPTIQAIHDGYEIYVAEDCCGDVSQLAHDNAMRRVEQAGAKDVVRTHYGAYGSGVEYAYTMVHGAPPTVLPEYQVPKAEMAHK